MSYLDKYAGNTIAPAGTKCTSVHPVIDCEEGSRGLYETHHQRTLQDA